MCGGLTATKPSTGYGKGTATVGDAGNTSNGYDPAADVSDKVIKISVTKAGKVTMTWE